MLIMIIDERQFLSPRSFIGSVYLSHKRKVRTQLDEHIERYVSWLELLCCRRLANMANRVFIYKWRPYLLGHAEHETGVLCGLGDIKHKLLCRCRLCLEHSLAELNAKLIRNYLFKVSVSMFLGPFVSRHQWRIRLGSFKVLPTPS